jgi:hypothetical protein
MTNRTARVLFGAACFAMTALAGTGAQASCTPGAAIALTPPLDRSEEPFTSDCGLTRSDAPERHAARAEPRADGNADAQPASVSEAVVK